MEEKKLLNYLPLNPTEILNHKKGWRYGNYKLYQRLNNLSKLEDNEELKKGHAIWLEHLICFYNSLCQIRNVSPEIRSIDSVNIFIELCRTHYRIMSKKIENDRNILKESLFKPLYNENIFVFAMKHTSSDNFTDGFQQEKIDWNKPILEYNQEDVMNGLLMLTEKIDQISCSKKTVEETKKILELLYTRNSMFICEIWKENDPVFNMNGFTSNCYPNRDYFTFTGIYFYGIQRRIFYNELITESKTILNITPEMIQRCTNWIEKTICDNLENETFEKIYAQSCNEAYVFPGDYEWFSYRYPDLGTNQIAPILECFRKELAKKYFSEYRISLQTVLASVNLDTHTALCARLFLVNVIDMYMKNHYDFKWKDIVIISNEMLEGATEDIIRDEGETPLLIQTFSRYCVYNDFGIYNCDNFYETLTVWFFLIKQRGKKHRFQKLIDLIIDNVKPKVGYTGKF